MENSDGIILGSEAIDEELDAFIKEKEIAVLPFQEENIKESYLNFYSELISEE